MRLITAATYTLIYLQRHVGGQHRGTTFSLTGHHLMEERRGGNINQFAVMLASICP